MSKKISLGVTITIALIAMAVTFSLTMVVSMNMFNSTVSSVKSKERQYNKLAEIDRWELRAEYQDSVADVHAPLHDLRRPRDRRARACLATDSYTTSQAVAADLLAGGSVG